MITTKKDLVTLAIKMHDDLNAARRVLDKVEAKDSRWLRLAATVAGIELPDLVDGREYSFRMIDEQHEMIFKYRQIFDESAQIFRSVDEEDVMLIEVI